MLKRSIKNLSRDTKEIDRIKNSVVNRLETVDKLSRVFEKTLDSLHVLGNPLEIEPGADNYEDAINLYIKLNKSHKDLVESYRKLKITEFDIKEKYNKIEMMNTFMNSIEGKTPEQIRSLIKKGKFTPVNMALASLFGSAVNGDTNAGRSIMGGMNNWGSSEDFDSEVPKLTVNLNLSDKEKQRMVESGETIKETIDISPT